MVKPVQAVPQRTVRGIQELVAGTPALDGVGVNDAFFDPDGKLVLAGVWRGESQQPELHKLATDYLRSEPPGQQPGRSAGAIQVDPHR